MTIMIQNEARYEAAIQRNISINARKTRACQRVSVRAG
jgi:hypothetical protein